MTNLLRDGFVIAPPEYLVCKSPRKMALFSQRYMAGVSSWNPRWALLRDVDDAEWNLRASVEGPLAGGLAPVTALASVLRR